MYSLFNQPLTYQTRGLRIPRWDILKSTHRDNCEKVIFYYRHSNKTVRSDHLLAQLIRHYPLSIHLSDEEYWHRTRDYTNDLMRRFNLTSPLSAGRSFNPSIFYGEGCEDIIITSHITQYPEDDDWENWIPLRFMRHPFIDFTLTPPYGKPYSSKKGIIVAILDIPLLLLQYKQWRLRELDINPDDPKSSRQFVANYPLINALYSIQDLVFFNALRARVFKESLMDSKTPHPFKIHPRVIETEAVLDQWIGELIIQDLSFDELLNGIDPFHQPNLQQVFSWPSMPMTRHLIWGIIAARLPLFHWLLTWQTMTNTRKNLYEIGLLNRTLKRMRMERIMSDAVSLNTRLTLLDELNNWIRPHL